MFYAVDFDETLNLSSLDKVFNPNYKLISFLRDKSFFILTARDDTEYNREYINTFLKSNLIFPEKVLFSNRELKGPILKSEGADILIDDKQEQRQSAKENGVNAIHPDNLDSIANKISINKVAKEIVTKNVYSDYIGPDGLRDKSWFRTNDKSWYYWTDGSTDLKNKPLDPDDALRDLIDFLYKNKIETLPSCEGHVMSKSEAISAFNKLKKDKEKINGEGLELTNTEDKSKKIIFKNPNYNLPFKKPEDMVQEHYSGYIGFKLKDKSLKQSIFKKIKKIDNLIKVKLTNDALHVYVESNSQKKQKDLWKKITEVIKEEVKNFKKEARKTSLSGFLKKAKDPKKGTGKKPKGSGRRLYTDENPKDTVPVKFRTVSDIKETLSRSDFKSKSHARQSQIINLIYQRVRAAYENAKDPKTKARLRRALKYAEKIKEKSKEKTKKLKKESSGKKVTLNKPDNVYQMLLDNPNPKVYLDNPVGSKKGFGDKKRKLPFDYGEFSDWINPADKMGWDIIIPPSNRKQTNLIQVGIIRVNSDKFIWKEKANRKPPISNDKIIVASNGEISDKDKKIIEDFFNEMWQFEKVEWFNGVKKEARKKRLSFFRTNLDYGERGSSPENNAEDYNASKKDKKWSIKYKRKINCSNPKGFSQKQYCKRKNRGGAYKE